MRRLSLQQFDELSEKVDQAALASGAHAHFCSSSDWILPAQQALMPEREPWMFELEGGFVALMRGTHNRGFHYVEPLEAMWGLSCPVLGQVPPLLLEQFEELVVERTDEWDVLALSGLVRGSPLLRELQQRFSRRFALRTGSASSRFVASLAGGVDGFLSRRSRNFRKSLGKSARAAQRLGIYFETVDEIAAESAPAIFERILAVERCSWKGHAASGIAEGPMCDFYRAMLPRLAARGSHRLMFARWQGRDVAYIFGARFGDTYRGLQFSYDVDLAHLSLGNVCQLRQIELLCAEGCTSYDLGGGLEYKRRWAELEVETEVALVVNRSR